MKRFIAIFFLLVYVISLTEFNQLVKLPVLVEHFKEHKSKNKELTLLKFLAMHYADEQAGDADHDTDMKLPFKSHEGCLNAMIEVYVPASTTHSITKPAPIGIKSYLPYSESFLNSSFLSSIWQPPKFC